MNFKKILLLILAFALLVLPLTGCRKEPTPAPSPSPSPSGAPSPSPSPSPSAPAGGGEMKLGLGIVTSVAKSKSAGEADGAAQTDMTIAAVMLDKDGRIVRCVLDGLTSTIAFNKNGELVTPKDTVFQSKNDLGEAYGMKKASGIGKEWYEQAAAFASYVQGKTLEEVKAIKVDEQNYLTGADIKSSVTISVGGFLQAIEKAVTSAQDAPEGLSESDTLRVGLVADASGSASAGEKDGAASLAVTVAAVARNSGGVITGCVIDSVSSSVTFSKSGAITSDLSLEIQSKNELGEAYGMKKASSLGKEWYEQAKAFADYVTGKTLSEVKGIAVSESGTPQSEDLKSSVTIHIGEFISAIEKAAAAG